jgi:hypothetical protein
MPGARGRLFANLIYKLANNDPTPIVLTEQNSAHNFIDTWDMKYVSDIKNIYTSEHTKPVFFTHLYPSLEDNSSKTGTIFINVSSSKVVEVCMNAVIKNVISKIEFLQDGISWDETQRTFMKTYDRFLPDNYIDILTDTDKMQEFFKHIQQSSIPLSKSYYKNFIENNELRNTKVLFIDYEKMFDRENGKYIVLKRLTDWMELSYNDEIHSIYEQYDLNKFNIFKKYCPWFNTITE